MLARLRRHGMGSTWIIHRRRALRRTPSRVALSSMSATRSPIMAGPTSRRRACSRSPMGLAGLYPRSMPRSPSSPARRRPAGACRRWDLSGLTVGILLGQGIDSPKQHDGARLSGAISARPTPMSIEAEEADQRFGAAERVGRNAGELAEGTDHPHGRIRAHRQHDPAWSCGTRAGSATIRSNSTMPSVDRRVQERGT